MIDKDLLNEDPDGWSFSVVQHFIPVLPNEDLRDLFRQWQEEAENEPDPDTWAWWADAEGDCDCDYCNPLSMDASLDGCRKKERKKPKEWQNPTDYGFKGWELE